MSLQELRYETIHELGLAVATTCAMDSNGKPLRLPWYAAKLWVQERGLYLMLAGEYLRLHQIVKGSDSDLARSLDDECIEITDTLIATPSLYGTYSHRLDPRPNNSGSLLFIQESKVYGTDCHDYTIREYDAGVLPVEKHKISGLKNFEHLLPFCSYEGNPVIANIYNIESELNIRFPTTLPGKYSLLDLFPFRFRPVKLIDDEYPREPFDIDGLLKKILQQPLVAPELLTV